MSEEKTRWVPNLTSKIIKSVSIGAVIEAHWSCKECGSNKGKNKPKKCESVIRTLNKERYDKACEDDSSEEDEIPDEFYDTSVCQGTEFVWVKEDFCPFDTYSTDYLDFWKDFKNKGKAHK